MSHFFFYCKLVLVVLRVQTPLEDSLDQLLTLLMIYMCIIIGRNALIEEIFKIFDKAVFEVIEAEEFEFELRDFDQQKILKEKDCF